MKATKIEGPPLRMDLLYPYIPHVFDTVHPLLPTSFPRLLSDGLDHLRTISFNAVPWAFFLPLFTCFLFAKKRYGIAIFLRGCLLICLLS